MQAAAARRALVDRLEILARKRPGYYRFRVVMLALLGLGYRVLIWAAMFAMPIAVTLMFYPTGWTLVIGGVLLVLFGIFWFKPPPTEGRRLLPADAPQLFAELEALRAKTGAPHVHEVYLSGDFNASAAAVPRLGLFGWYKQVLTFGVPLLAALSREQALAIAGHELGHFSKEHGRLDHWIYRARHAWENLHAQVGDEDSGLGAAVSQFYRSFVPYFSAYSFVLARLCEYEADADAARACDRPTAGSALAAVHAYGAYFESRFWPAFWRTALVSPVPPVDVYRRLAEAARTANPGELETFQREALRRVSDLADTHPCLADRLRALQVADIRVSPPAVCAGQALLGERWGAALDEASKAWRDKRAGEWRDAHHELADCALRLAELPADRSSLAVRMEVAKLTDALRGAQTALEHWRVLRAEAPDDARVAFRWACALAGQQDPAAFTEFEALAEREPGYAAAATRAMKDLALALGDQAAADGYDARRRKAAKATEEAEQALMKQLERGALQPHSLAEHTTALLTRQLQADGLIAGAYLAAVRPGEVRHFGGTLLLIRIDPEAMQRAGSDPISIVGRCRALLAPVLEPNQFPWVANFYITEAVDAKIGAALAAIESSRLYGNLDSPEGTLNDWR